MLNLRRQPATPVPASALGTHGMRLAKQVVCSLGINQSTKGELSATDQARKGKQGRFEAVGRKAYSTSKSWEKAGACKASGTRTCHSRSSSPSGAPEPCHRPCCTGSAGSGPRAPWRAVLA